MADRCPICGKIVVSDLESHANKCLDSLEWKKTGGSGESGGDEAKMEEMKHIGRQTDQNKGKIKGRANEMYSEKEVEEVDVIKKEPGEEIAPRISQETRTSSNKREHKNAFALLGLRADNGNNKSRKIDSKKVQKDRATLTSILIAERRLQSNEKKVRRDDFEEGNTGLTYADNEVHPVENVPESDFKENYEKDDTGDFIRPLEIDQSATFSKNKASQRDSDNNAARSNSFADELTDLRKDSLMPLAQRVRPKVLEDFFGQEHLVGPSGLLRSLIGSGVIPSFILWGNPGVGKTSLARIIGKSLNYKFVEVSGSEGNAKTLKEVFAKAETDMKLKGTKTILFLDEIHRFNKAVQDLLLPVIEKGVLTVIGATTENPSFSLNSALLSRMHTFTMKPLTKDAIMRILYKGLYHINRTRKYINGLCNIALKKDGSEYIAKICGGDSRMALNILETVHVFLSHKKFSSSRETSVEGSERGRKVVVIDTKILKPLIKTKNYHQVYDRKGDAHYDTISAFHKSVRGSDPDAAIFYLTKMLMSGEDPLFIARRMIVIASEDIGLRNSNCLPFAIAVKDAIEFIGMPEGEIVLAHCAVKLAMEPKSTKSYRALRSAQSYIRENPEASALPIPLHLRNAPTALMKELGYGDTYKYNPNYRSGIVKQKYLPQELNDVKFLEEQHLGIVKDEEVADKIHDEAEKEEEEFERFRKSEINKERLNFKAANESRKISHNSVMRNGVSDDLKRIIKQILEENPDFLKDQSILQDDLKISNVYGGPTSTQTDISVHGSDDSKRKQELYSYDEFLSKEDQPKYFDGEEKDVYSDDPDCSNNFEKSYDEFRSEEEQPDYFDPESSAISGKETYL